MANSVDLDEVAHHEPPHQDLHCLQIQLFLSLALKKLNNLSSMYKFFSFLLFSFYFLFYFLCNM